jgi:hypothetical protein
VLSKNSEEHREIVLNRVETYGIIIITTSLRYICNVGKLWNIIITVCTTNYSINEKKTSTRK